MTIVMITIIPKWIGLNPAATAMGATGATMTRPTAVEKKQPIANKNATTMEMMT